MEESLRSWLRSSYAEIISDDLTDAYAAADENQMLLSLGRYVFGLADDSCFQTVLEEMTSHFGRDLTSFTRTSSIFCVEACLICAVASMSADRTRFVQIIMRMEPVVKAHIMEAIKNNLRHYFDTDQSSTEAGDRICAIAEVSDSCPASIIAGSTSIASLDKSKLSDLTESSRGSENSMENTTSSNFCSHCAGNEKKSANLVKDLEFVIHREKGIEAKLRIEITVQTNKLIDAEIIIIEKDEKLSEKSCLLEAALCSIQEYERKIRESNKIMNELQVIQDEIDILKPKADRADASEQQLEKVRSRLDELKGVRQQLKAESAAHTVTHAKLIDSQQELDTLRKAKIQVDEYRSQCSESAIQIEELSVRLKQRDDQINCLNEECTFIKSGQLGQRLEAQHLNNELNAANEQIRNNREGGESVGQGMSELNPALMNELHKLRSENEDLVRKINASSIDALDLLESQIADQKCINKSLQEKWMTAKDSLSHTLNVVSTLNCELTMLSIEYATFQQSSSDLRTMAQEDLLSLRNSHELKLIDFKYHYEQNINDINTVHQSAVGLLMNDLQMTEEKLKDTTVILVRTQIEKEGLIVDLSFLEQELNEEKKLRTQDQDSARIAAEDSNNLKIEEIDCIRQDGQEKMQLLIENNEINLLTEIERARDAAAELDSERIKRRRADREKKFFEAETHRLKTLLTVSSGGGTTGQEIEEALQEMKLMQTQLDEANMEIQQMRSQGLSDVSRSAEEAAVSVEGSRVQRGITSTMGGAVRSQRGRDASMSAIGSSSNFSANTGNMGGVYGGYLEQTEVIDKRVEQLIREKRELLSKNLEENKERIEISQKLICSEREVRNLKAKVTKMTLEKERSERRIANQANTDMLSLNLTKSSMCGSIIGCKRTSRETEDQENII